MTFYSDLGVDPSASSDEIKKAYRKEAARSHPDKGGDTARFQVVQRAYAVLKDEKKRAEYDRTGEEPEVDHRTQVLHALAGLVLTAVENCPDLERTDLKAAITVSIREGQTRARVSIRNLEKKLKRYATAMKRFKRKTGGSALILQMLESSKRDAQAGITNMLKQIQLGEEMLEILNEYEYEVDTGIMQVFSEEVSSRDNRWTFHNFTL